MIIRHPSKGWYCQVFLYFDMESARLWEHNGKFSTQCLRALCYRDSLDIWHSRLTRDLASRSSAQADRCVLALSGAPPPLQQQLIIVVALVVVVVAEC